MESVGPPFIAHLAKNQELLLKQSCLEDLWV